MKRETFIKPAYTAPIIVLIALSGCSREAETREAPVTPLQEIGAVSDTDAPAAEDAKPTENDPAMRSPVEFD